MSEAICGTPRDTLTGVPRISRSPSSGARSRDPLAHPGYARWCTHAAAFGAHSSSRICSRRSSDRRTGAVRRAGRRPGRAGWAARSSVQRFQTASDMTPRSRDDNRPSFAVDFTLFDQRAQGRPGADRTHGPRAMGRKLGNRTTGVTGNIRPSLRDGCAAYFVLSPARLGFFVTVSRRCFASRGRHLPLGRQDHTTSPSASCALVSRALGVHRIPHHVRDDRDPPLVSGGMRILNI
ncbi:hypothetical protein ACVMIH_000809 [Bradyrhizobium sp. USDA 4503]